MFLRALLVLLALFLLLLDVYKWKLLLFNGTDNSGPELP